MTYAIHIALLTPLLAILIWLHLERRKEIKKLPIQILMFETLLDYLDSTTLFHLGPHTKRNVGEFFFSLSDWQKYFAPKAKLLEPLSSAGYQKKDAKYIAKNLTSAIPGLHLEEDCIKPYGKIKKDLESCRDKIDRAYKNIEEGKVSYSKAQKSLSEIEGSVMSLILYSSLINLIKGSTETPESSACSSGSKNG